MRRQLADRAGKVDIANLPMDVLALTTELATSDGLLLLLLLSRLRFLFRVTPTPTPTATATTTTSTMAAISAFRKGIVFWPDDAWAHNLLGEALQRQGSVDEAIAAIGLGGGHGDLGPGGPGHAL